MLVVTDLGRGVLLIAIPVLALTHHLSLAVLMVFMAAFGLLSLLGDAASQSVLPGMNATRRSINRAMIVIGAPVGGILGDAVGYRVMLWVAAAGFLACSAGLALSPFRSARVAELTDGLCQV